VYIRVKIRLDFDPALLFSMVCNALSPFFGASAAPSLEMGEVDALLQGKFI
jgi:hypothetical protein